jgi:hypothetical protein
MNLTRPDRSSLERIMPWVVGGFFALPVLIAKFPPMADLPLHEASVGILRHWGDARFAPPSVYMLNLGHANQLFSLVVYLFSIPLPIDWALKITVAGALLALPLAAAHFASYVGSNRWAALLVAPLGLGWLFFWGLIQNIVGLAVFVGFLPTIDRFATVPTWRGLCAVCGVLLLCFFAHEAVLLAACCTLFVCSVVAPPVPRRAAWILRVVPFVFSAVVVVAGKIYDQHVAGPWDLAAPGASYLPLVHKLTSIPGVLFGGFEPYVRNLMMALAIAPVVMMLRTRLRSASPAATRRAWLHRWRFEFVALVLFAAYLLLPVTIRSTTLVYHRFLPPAWAIVAVSAGAHVGTSMRRVTRMLCGALPVASLLIAWPSFADSNRIYTELEPLLQQVEIGSTVAVLVLGPVRHRLWSVADVAGHIVAVRGGKSVFDFTQSPTSPAIQRPSKRWVSVYRRMDGYPLNFRPGWDLTLFRYVFVMSPDPAMPVLVARAFGDQAKFIAQSGDWYLFESQMQLVPIDADDTPLPHPAPPTLRHEFRRIAGEVERAKPRDDNAGEP